MLFSKKIEKIYRSQIYIRTELSSCVRYFTHKDFDGLEAERYYIKASAGHTLAGCFYSYPLESHDHLVVFEHGMGGGHISYMREIELLARRGYLVFAYDHTGCVNSGGESINGFAQSLCDANDVIGALLADEKYKNMKISVIGHSWGGFSALNIGAIYPELTHIVALAGFASVESILHQTFSGLLSGFYRRALEIETESHPKFVGFSASDSLKKTAARVLVIHSTDDPVVSYKRHFVPTQRALSGYENVEFLTVTKKGHNPNYTEDAVKYKDEFFADLKKRSKKGTLATEEQRAAFVDSYDFERMTEQDPEIWDKIFDFLEG